MCSPTRQNIYTGLYPVKSGAYPNHSFVKEGVQSVAHYLKPLGYRVALSGKRHISPAKAYPFEYSGKKNPDMGAIEALFRESAENQTPFCQFVCSNEPHAPWNKGDASAYPVDEVKLPPYFVDTPKTRAEFAKYLAEITYYDDQVGQVLALLEKHGLADDTIVMVVSEQGNSFPFAKWTCYDNGLQSAMIAKWPGRIDAGSVSDAMVEYVDVLPTFLEAAGGEIPAVLDGKSMLNVLTGKADQHKDYVFGIQTSRGIFGGPDHYGVRSVRSRRFKLIHNLAPEARFQNTIDRKEFFKEWKQRAESGDAHAEALVNRYHYRPEYELYDVVADPLEQNNLVDNPAYTDEIKPLKAQLEQWMKSQGDMGQNTEMAAIDRMNAGNKMVKEALGKNPRAKGGKKGKRKAKQAGKKAKDKAGRKGNRLGVGRQATGARGTAAARTTDRAADLDGMNVLFIAIDDLNNYPSLMRNYPGVKTPSLDAFAKTSLQFTRAYSPGTMCNPSRSAILSGVAPYRSGIYANGQQWRDSPQLCAAKTLPQAFRDSGYHTMGCGKLYHSSPTDQQWSLQWDDDDGGQGKFAPRVSPRPIPASIKGPANFTYGVVDESEVRDFQLIEYAKKRLQAEYDQPFFMAHGICYPHNPWVTPQRFVDMYPDGSFAFPPPGFQPGDLQDVPQIAKKYARPPVSRRALAKAGHWKPTVRHYLASISAADAILGEILASLDASKHKDNTIVVVWADHGFHMGEKDHFAKYALWEQTTNVLLMVRVPGMTAGGATCERTVSLQDLYPTLVQLCGLDDPGHALDGRSFVKLLEQPHSSWPHPALTTHLQDDYALRNETHRYIRYHDNSEELYDHASDPFEWVNQADAQDARQIIAQLAVHLPSQSTDPPVSTNRKAKRGKRRQSQ